MGELSRMPKWPACVMAAIAAACANPAETNNATTDSDDNGQIVDNAIVDPELPTIGNAAAAPAAATSPAKAVRATAAPPESYSAVGQEPGWSLKIGDGRIDYVGNYGEKKIEVARPEPETFPNGRRYATTRLTMTVSYTRCNDAMSGFGFEHQVTVVADGETFKGCGGARKKEWDM